MKEVCVPVTVLFNLTSGYYPFYQDDVWIEITDDLAAQLKQWEREESNRQRKRRRYHDYSFSDFQERCMKYECFAPDELYERKLTRQQLHAAISTLPDKQAKRIYAYCVLGISMAKIAAAEGVSYVAVRSSILRGLDTVDNSQINVLSQRTMHRICTAATNEEVSFAYRVAIPRQRFRWRNAFSTRWRSL